MSVQIVTDTSCDLPARLEREIRDLGVRIVPFLFHFGLDTLRDKTISMREFLGRAENVWPTTAVPSSEQFLQAFRECVEAGHRVVCITITSKHSSTYSTATLASQQFPRGHVAVVDSKAISLAQGILVLSAARAAHAGKSLEQVVETVQELRERLHLFISLDTVKYLVKGGRASRLSGGLADLLKIRPILTMQDGELTLVDKPRGRKAAKRRLLERVRGCLPADIVGVAHIVCESEARDLVAEISSETGGPEDSILFTETGMVIATHGGPGALGVVVASI